MQSELEAASQLKIEETEAECQEKVQQLELALAEEEKRTAELEVQVRPPLFS
eukprot:COSAG05_NODE_8302_length_716_cov_5.806135_2_plen_52_part_00